MRNAMLMLNEELHDRTKRLLTAEWKKAGKVLYDSHSMRLIRNSVVDWATGLLRIRPTVASAALGGSGADGGEDDTSEMLERYLARLNLTRERVSTTSVTEIGQSIAGFLPLQHLERIASGINPVRQLPKRSEKFSVVDQSRITEVPLSTENVAWCQECLRDATEYELNQEDEFKKMHRVVHKLKCTDDDSLYAALADQVYVLDGQDADVLRLVVRFSRACVLRTVKNRWAGTAELLKVLCTRLKKCRPNAADKGDWLMLKEYLAELLKPVDNGIETPCGAPGDALALYALSAVYKRSILVWLPDASAILIPAQRGMTQDPLEIAVLGQLPGYFGFSFGSVLPSRPARLPVPAPIIIEPPPVQNVSREVSLVVDSNVLLERSRTPRPQPIYHELLSFLLENVTDLGFYVPHAVWSELSGLKNNLEKGAAARDALRYLEQLQSRMASVRGARFQHQLIQEDTDAQARLGGRNRDDSSFNDKRIVEAARLHVRRAVILSRDRDLRSAIGQGTAGYGIKFAVWDVTTISTLLLQ